MQKPNLNINIRNYHPSDLPYLYKICLLTADSGKDATSLYSDPFLVGQFSAAPYAFCEPELTYILTLDEIPFGYILGTKNSAEFYNWRNDNWLPILRERYKLSAKTKSLREANIIALIHKGTSVKEELLSYPAHLHIDLLPEVQGLGMGKKLIKTFINKLRELNITALHLEVGKGNTGAINFYEKVGFHIIKEYEKSIAYGIKLGK